MARDADRLNEVLARLLDLAETDADRETVEELLRRSESQAFRVLVAGEAKRGKSSLINALLRQPLLPTGVVPLTAVATTVVYGHDPDAQIRFRDGTQRTVPVDEIETYVSETANPDNQLGVTQVVVSVPAELLATGAELVDTPGTGSVHRHNTDEALAAYDRMDAAVFVLTADPPISDSERLLVQTIRDSSVATWFVLNKIDRLSVD